MSKVAWKLETLSGSETYTFEVNPNERSTPHPTRDIQWDHSREGYSGRRAGKSPHPWEFSGTLRSQEQYDAMVTWVNKRAKVRITTDLGERYVIRMVAFLPQQAKHSIRAPYRQDYTVRCLIVEVLPTIDTSLDLSLIATDDFARPTNSRIALSATKTGGLTWQQGAVGGNIGENARIYGVGGNQPRARLHFPENESNGTSGSEQLLLQAGTPDVDVRVTNVDGKFVGIVFRWLGTNSFWLFAPLLTGAGWEYALSFGSDNYFGPQTRLRAPGDALRVVVKGSLITTYVNGAVHQTLNNAANASASQHGFVLTGATSTSIGINPQASDFALRRAI